MQALVIYWVVLAYVLIGAFVAHDVYSFAEARERVNAAISNLTASEMNPSPAVRKAFYLDDPNLIAGEGFAIYQSEFFRRGWNEIYYFNSRKIIAGPMFVFETWLSFDRRQLEAFRLRRLNAEALATVIFGRGLNSLGESELGCVARLVRGQRYRSDDPTPVCPEPLPALTPQP